MLTAGRRVILTITVPELGASRAGVPGGGIRSGAGGGENGMDVHIFRQIFYRVL